MKRAKIILAILGYILTVCLNIPHLANSYINTGVIETTYTWNIITIAVIDLGILILAINDRRWFAQVFAFLIFLLNLDFYWGGIPFPETYYEWVGIFPGFLWSLVPAFFIDYFSELISELFKPEYASDRQEIESLRVEIGNLRIEIDNDKETIETYRPVFESVMALNGQKITVGGVKAKKCLGCHSVHVAGSNKEQNRVCECGELIEWN